MGRWPQKDGDCQPLSVITEDHTSKPGSRADQSRAANQSVGRWEAVESERQTLVIRSYDVTIIIDHEQPWVTIGLVTNG